LERCALLSRCVVAVITLLLAASVCEVSASDPTANCPHSYDALHYGLTLLVDVEGELISGRAAVRAVSEETALETVDLDFAVLTVDSVLRGGVQVAAVHDDPVLTIDLGEPVAAGDTFEVEVFYHGHPGNSGSAEMGGFYFDGFPKCAVQVGKTPNGGLSSMVKYLFPCWDWPCDKATAEFHITVLGTGKKVICNGVLEATEIDSVANTATYHWVEDRPVATHCVNLHAGRFTDLVDSTYNYIHYFVYPRLVEDALINFENVPAMMDVFEDAFGPFPFPGCAYISSPQADVAHQGCIAYPASAITTSHDNDWHVCQGLARQWWGACVGVGDWRDVWLQESFGRYGQPLFEEVAYGAEAYEDYVYHNLMVHTFNDADPHSPVYDPLHPGGHTIYEKGAVVLHMLRFVLGDSTFFGSLRAFREAHEYDVATTYDLQAAVEAEAGTSLAWFFDEWIYGCGWPEFDYAWDADAAGDAWEISLIMNQVQEAGPVFTMPFEVGVTTARGDTVFTVWVDEAHEEFTLAVSDEPLALALDPDRWVLHRATEVAYAGVACGNTDAGFILRVAPNPARGGAVIGYSLPARERARVTIYDAAGRAVAQVFEGVLGPGRGDLWWDGRRTSGEPAAPGTYFCRLVAGADAVSTRVIVLR
jgi:aminopeptidase N